MPLISIHLGLILISTYAILIMTSLSRELPTRISGVDRGGENLTLVSLAEPEREINMFRLKQRLEFDFHQYRFPN